MRSAVSNLEKLNLPTKHCGTTGESTRGSGETARRPPSVKAALSVSFGQRAPHRASTRDSSPIRRTIPPPSDDKDNIDDSRRPPRDCRSRSRELPDRDYIDREHRRDRERDRSRGRNRERYSDRDREREQDRNRERERDRKYEYDRRSRESRRDNERSNDSGQHREGGSHRSRGGSQSMFERSLHDNHHTPPRDGGKEKNTASSNLAKLKDIYGDSGNQEELGKDRGPSRDSGSEEVIRLGGSTWR